MSLVLQRPQRMNEKPSVLPAVEVIAPGGSYNPDFFSHQVMPRSDLSVIFLKLDSLTKRGLSTFFLFMGNAEALQ